MRSLIDFLLLVLSILTGIWLYRKYLEYKESQRKKEEELLNFISSKVKEVKDATERFEYLSNVKTGYFSKHDLTVWTSTYSKLFSELHNIAFEKTRVEIPTVSMIQIFLDYYSGSEARRLSFNQMFLKEELIAYSKFFDNIENRKLDLQQRNSIIANEDNSLVTAGAGSGKTTTIVGKVNYIIDRYKVDPQQILLISFTRKSASELAGRINVEGITVKTFHRFGMDVIAAVSEKKPSIYEEVQFKPFITNTFNTLLKDDSYLEMVNEYFVDYLKSEKSKEEFENQGEYFQYLKDQNFRTYKEKELYANGNRTMRKEIVKSIEECKIANFLYFNNVEYRYEYPYEYDTATQNHRQYRPDFTITDNGKKIYLEHFAISKTGKVPEWFARLDKGETWETATRLYNEGIEWKRNEHRKNSTTLLETFSYEMFENTLFEKLSKNLSSVGVQLTPMSPQEKWKVISESAQEEVDSIILLFQTFITLMKSNNCSIDDLLMKNSKLGNSLMRKRNELFIKLVKPLYNQYQLHLADRKEIDFSDMINLASEYVTSGKYTRKFKYIIIDEFQDISIGRYKLIQAIKLANKGCKLFAVGDDWQSIYRFTGSDITLFKDFETFFGFTIKSKIETTYRFKNPLIKLSSDFILKNPNQEKKELKAAGNTSETNYQIIYSLSNDQDDTLALKDVLDQLSHKVSFLDKKTILILGRYNNDLKRLKNEKLIFQIDQTTGVVKYQTTQSNGQNITINAQFMTVHKSKGLEADIVIVINCNSGSYGFPSEMSDDMVLDLLLSKSDQYENGEERRLFYVAMTRAKENLFLITDINYKSKFIAELETGDNNSLIKKCPRCKTSDLKYKTGVSNNKKWAFYSCSNYIYGCNYQEWDNS